MQHQKHSHCHQFAISIFFSNENSKNVSIVIARKLSKSFFKLKMSAKASSVIKNTNTD